MKHNRIDLIIIPWTVGCKSQFKCSRPLWFLTKFWKMFNFQFRPRWYFFQSCHGKGMQDAAGAWVKSRVSRAVWFGVDIKNAAEYFEFCKEYLSTQSNQTALKKQNPFTSRRRFVLLPIMEVSAYRRDLEKVGTWKGLNAGWFAFWPTGESEGGMARQWLACMCNACFNLKFEECETRGPLTLDGKWHNQPEKGILVARKRTTADEISDAQKVLICSLLNS